MARSLPCGTVSVNGFSERDSKTPFGGYKMSASQVHDNCTAALAQYMQTKAIWITTWQVQFSGAVCAIGCRANRRSLRHVVCLKQPFCLCDADIATRDNRFCDAVDVTAGRAGGDCDVTSVQGHMPPLDTFGSEGP